MHSVSVNPAILIDEGKTHGLVGDVYGTHGALLDGGGGYKCRLGQACQIRHFDLDIQTPLPGAYQNGLQAGRGLIDVYAEVTPRQGQNRDASNFQTRKRLGFFMGSHA